MMHSEKTHDNPHEEVDALRRRVAELERALERVRAPHLSANVEHFRSDHPYRLIADNASDLIWTIEFPLSDDLTNLLASSDSHQLAWELFETSEFSYASPASQRLLGYTPEQMRNRTVKQILTGPSFEVAASEFAGELVLERQGATDPDRSRTVEAEHLCADGTTRWCEVQGKLLRDDNGRITGLLGVTRDISERKRAEQATEAALEELSRFHATVNRSPAVVLLWRVAEGWPVEFVSDNVVQFGYTPGELTSGRVSWPSITHPEDLPRLEAEVARYRRENIVEFDQEYRLITKSGEVRWVEDRNLAVVDADGEARYVQGIVLDVTDRKRAEQQLRESESTLRQLFTHLPDFVLVVDSDAKIQFVNRAAPGADADELIGTIGFTHILPAYQSACRRALEQAFASGTVQSVEARTVFDAWWDCRLVPMLGNRAKPTVMIICTDITHRRTAERSTRIQLSLSSNVSETSDLDQALATSLDAMLQVSEMDCGGIYLVNQDGGVDLATQRGLAEDFVRKVCHYDADSPQVQLVTAGQPLYARIDQLPPGIRAVCEMSSVKSVAFVPLCHEGRAIACVNLASHSFQDVPRSVRGMLEATSGLIGSVIARIQAQDALRQSEERLRLVVENVTDLVWATRMEGMPELLARASDDTEKVDFDALHDQWRCTYVSPSVQQILGYSVDEWMRLRPRQFLTPNAYLALREHSLAALTALHLARGEEAEPHIIELEHVMADGQLRWCEITWTFLFNERGEAVGVEGVTRDVSQRRTFERNLSEWLTSQQQQMGRELHDQLGQQLVGTRLLAEALQHSLAGQTAPEAETAGQLVTALSGAERHVRELIKGVRPVEVDAKGLMSALSELARSTRELQHIPCSFQCDRPVPVEDSHTATQLFYIAREAVHNAVKHASARQITIGLAAGDNELQLWVTDDGTGIRDDTGLPAAGMGLKIMRYRASVIGANLTFDSTCDGGTRVLCTLRSEQMS